MTEIPQLSGVDLARVALRAAKAAAQKNGGGRSVQPKPRTTRVVRRDGREASRTVKRATGQAGAY
jgi:hypothetical protein